MRRFPFSKYINIFNDSVCLTTICNTSFLHFAACFGNLPRNIARAILMQAASSTCRKEREVWGTVLRCRIEFTEPLMLWQHSASSLIFRSACLGISGENNNVFKCSPKCQIQNMSQDWLSEEYSHDKKRPY